MKYWTVPEKKKEKDNNFTLTTLLLLRRIIQEKTDVPLKLWVKNMLMPEHRG